MSPEVVTGLLTEPRPVDGEGRPAGIDLGSELLARLDDRVIARFVAGDHPRPRRLGTTAGWGVAGALRALGSPMP